MKYSGFILLIVLLIPTPRSCDHKKSNKEGDLYWLSNGNSYMGVLPRVGGRIVFFGSDAAHNMLKSDPELWNESDSLRPVVNADSPWKAYNGHTVWTGPQSEWWLHQEIAPAKKERGDAWPPDPWLIYAPYKVTEVSQTRIEMISPASPVTGLILTKIFSLESDGTAKIEVKAENTRDSAVQWDLWMNTRVEGYKRVYVPVGNSGNFRVNARRTKVSDTIAYEVRNGLFSYIPEIPAGDRKSASSKAFLTPSENWMAMVGDSVIFRITYDLYDPSLTHPEQGMIEIYNYLTSEPGGALTEMEFHGPYTEILPGESIELSETWSLVMVNNDTVLNLR